MSILRASIRTGRFDERKKAANILVSGPNGSANQEDDTSNDHGRPSRPEQDLTGHELDYVSFEMARTRIGSSTLGFFERNGDDRWCLSPWRTSNTCDINQHTATVGNGNIVFGALDELLTRESPEASHSNNAGNLILRYRARLGQLTSNSGSQQWPDSMVKGCSAAAAAVRAINQAMSLLPPSGPCNEGGLLLVPFDCSISIKASSDPAYQLRWSDMFQSSGKACFHLALGDLKHPLWRVDPYEIEAAVALMAWPQRQPFSSLQIIGVCVPEVSSFGIPSHYSLRPWACAGTAFHRLFKSRLNFSSMSSECVAHYSESADSFFNTIWIPRMDPSRMRDILCGWNAVPWKRLGTPSELTAYCAHVGGIDDLTCAQDLYGYLLLQLLQASDKALGDSDFVKTEEGYGIRNSKVDKLIDGFIRSGLGTKDDAVRCILPIVAASDHPSPVKDAIGAVLKSVREAIKSERYGDARSELNWLAELLVFEADNEQVFQWCLLKTGLYRCDSWKGHAHDGQAFEGSFFKDIELIDNLRLESGIKIFARDLFMRLWQMFCWEKGIHLQRSWDRQLACLFGPNCLELDLGSCLKNDDFHGALICIPSFAKEPNLPSEEDFMELLSQIGHALWQLAVQQLLSFEPKLIFRNDGADALSCACKNGSVTAVNFILGRLDMWRRKRLLIRRDTDDMTPVHYAVKGDQKDIITALGSELTQYWYSESRSAAADSQLDAKERDYLKENFGNWIGSQLIERETLGEKQAAGNTWKRLGRAGDSVDGRAVAGDQGVTQTRQVNWPLSSAQQHCEKHTRVTAYRSQV